MQINHLKFPDTKGNKQTNQKAFLWSPQKESTEGEAASFLHRLCYLPFVLRLCWGLTNMDLGYAPNWNSWWLREARSSKSTNKCPVWEMAWHLSYIDCLVGKIKFRFKHSCYFLLLLISCFSHASSVCLSGPQTFQLLVFTVLKKILGLYRTAILSYVLMIYCFPPERSLNTLHRSSTKFANACCLFSTPFFIICWKKM